MRIALVIERMDPSRGGREAALAEIAQGLAAYDCDVTILCQSANWDAVGVRVHTLGRQPKRRVSRLREFIHAVQGHVAGERYDIVHTTLPVPGADIYQLHSGTMPGQQAANLRRRTAWGRAFSRIARPYNSHRRCLLHLEQEVLRSTSQLCLPVSQLILRELKTYYRREQNVHVVFNGVVIPELTPSERQDWRRHERQKLGLLSDQPLFIAVATNFELKGITETIDAFAAWQSGQPKRRKRRSILAVVGRTRVGPYLRHVKRLGLGSQVKFIPLTSRIHRWWAAADACIHLTWYDPCSRVVLEATRWGVPSTTTAYNGAAEVLRDGAGIVVPGPRHLSAVVNVSLPTSCG